MMNTILPGGVFKTFGIIFNDVKEKYNSSAAMLSWIPSICIGLGLMSGEFRNLCVFGDGCKANVPVSRSMLSSVHPARLVINYILVYSVSRKHIICRN